MMCPMERDKNVGCFNHECHLTGMCMKSADPPTREERKEPMEQANEQRLIALLEDIAVSLHKIASHQERRLALLEECNSMQSDDLKMRYEVNAVLLGAAKKIEGEEPAQ